MKKTLLLLSVLLTIIGITDAFTKNSTNIFAFADNSSSEIVMEVESNRVLKENNSTVKRYMASTTKILTALVVILNTNMTDIITISKESVGIEGSSIYLEEGEKLSVKDLLFGLMLRSGNDCAHALALHCSNSIENFASLMNKTAKELGANNSNFVNPHGLHDDNHYTTAYDLALISCYAMKNPIFREIVSTKTIKIPFTTQNTVRLLKNKNKMLYNYENSTGIKTGYTKKAGRCLVSSAKRNGMEVVTVVLNCVPMFERSSELLNYSFENYKLYNLFNSDNILGFTSKNDEKIGLIIKNDINLPLTKDEYENLDIKINYPKNIDNLENSTKEIGSIEIYCQNNLLFTEKIFTII